jgi:diaminohydroxyphosphoribosylaminopyrimidine deaminase/5-amino-6-(5-phosphoribosylamino)uracil reductase
MSDVEFMSRALELSKKGNPSPNPYVGAVIVKNGVILSEGFHRRAGLPHAEVEALKKCRDPQDAVLYVTVEPCSHHGRTPPCTEAIIDAGISRVVYGMDDPNPLVSGREELRKAGLKVKGGVLRQEIERLNEAFIKYVKTGRPFVTLKAGMSLDGKIAAASGESKWITSKESRRIVHELRSRHEAVLVGVGTVLKDDPRLTCRLKGGRNPLKIILDSRLRIPLDAKVLEDGNVVVATTERFNRRKMRGLGKKADVWVVGEERVDLDGLMGKLGGGGITSVLIEGGGEVNASMLKAGIVDKLVLFIAPKIITGRDVPVFGGEGITLLRDAVGVEITSVERAGGDLVVEAYPVY